MQVITLLLAEPQRMVRRALRWALEDSGNLNVVSEVSSVGQATQEVTVHHPHVAIVDADLPETGGIQCCREIVALSKDTAVLLLAAADLDYLLFHSWLAGASGFIPKTADLDELTQAIEQAVGGNRLFTASQKHRVQVWQQEVEVPLQKLTRREREVLTLLGRAYTNRRIAGELAISEKAAEFHVSQILTKMNVPSRRDVAAWIERTGLDFMYMRLGPSAAWPK